jgi:ubiquinone biosynthesis protein
MADTTWGSFLEKGPWNLEEPVLWETSAESLRDAARKTAHDWISPRKLPPFRVVKVASTLGGAVLAWWIKGRKKPESRAVLSKKLVDAMESLGPAFVKLAQIISAGEGVFPDEIVRECKRLRDAARAEEYEIIKNRVEKSFNKPIGELFKSFEKTPIAAASIAQVHEAILPGGEKVVVKIRRSNIEKIVERDVKALAWLAPFLIGRLPYAALANPPALVELFAETIVEELDFRIEAGSMLQVARALAAQDRRGVVVPRPHNEMVASDVLVQEKVSGMVLSEVQKSSLEGKDVVQGLLACVLEGALIEGVFHGDLHAGNMFVLQDGRIALIDFGITARLSKTEKLSFARLITAGMSGDWRDQLKALQGLGAIPHGSDLESLGKDLGLDRPVDVATLGAEEMAKELQRLSKALLGSGAKLPKTLMLWAKNVVFIDAAIGELAPECDVLGVLGEVATRFVMQHGVFLANELGRGVEVSDSAIRNSMGIDASVSSMTWNELQARRALITSRAKKVLK